MTRDDLDNDDYLAGINVPPSIKRARVIEILEMVNETCSICANDQAYDVWVNEFNEVVDEPDHQDISAKNLAESFRSSSTKLHDLIADLTDNAFDNDTAAFRGLAQEFQDAAKDVMDKLAQLDSMGASIKTAIQIVSIVDEVISTAAGLSKF